jgi:hypothetical protein
VTGRRELLVLVIFVPQPKGYKMTKRSHNACLCVCERSNFGHPHSESEPNFCNAKIHPMGS